MLACFKALLVPTPLPSAVSVRSGTSAGARVPSAAGVQSEFGCVVAMSCDQGAASAEIRELKRERE